MKKSRFTESQIVAILKEADAGVPVSQYRNHFPFNDARHCL